MSESDTHIYARPYAKARTHTAAGPDAVSGPCSADTAAFPGTAPTSVVKFFGACGFCVGRLLTSSAPGQRSHHSAVQSVAAGSRLVVVYD
jgi:hypothetical protein